MCVCVNACSCLLLCPCVCACVRACVRVCLCVLTMCACVSVHDFPSVCVHLLLCLRVRASARHVSLAPPGVQLRVPGLRRGERDDADFGGSDVAGAGRGAGAALERHPAEPRRGRRPRVQPLGRVRTGVPRGYEK